KAHPATAPTPMAAPVESRFLRSIRLLRSVVPAADRAGGRFSRARTACGARASPGTGDRHRGMRRRRAACYSLAHVSALLLCVLLVLAPPGGWRGRRIDERRADPRRKRRTPRRVFFVWALTTST